MLNQLQDQAMKRLDALENHLILSAIIDNELAISTSDVSVAFDKNSTISRDLKEVKILRHCNIVTQVYSVFENLTENCIAFWLVYLPRFELLGNLDNKVQNAYRHGISKIVKDIDKRKYRHLNLSQVLYKYRLALDGNIRWEFVPEALTSHDHNLRKDVLIQMFSHVGLQSVWGFLEQFPAVREITIQADPFESLQDRLIALINYRNDAAHGNPDDILGLNGLFEVIKLVRELCNAICDFLRLNISSRILAHSPSRRVAHVTKKYNDNRYVIEFDSGSLNVGDKISFVRNNMFVFTEIMSLQVDGNAVESFQNYGPTLELGIQTKHEVGVNFDIINVNWDTT